MTVTKNCYWTVKNYFSCKRWKPQIDYKKTEFMPLKLWSLFANMFKMLLIWCKIKRKKLLQTTKVYSHPVKNVWISSLTLIMIFWWTEPFWEATEKFQNFIFNFEDICKRQFLFYQTLIAFFHTGKLVSPRVFMETSYSDGFYMLHVLNFSSSRVTVQIEYGW